MGDGKSERCLTLAELELDTCWDQHPCLSPCGTGFLRRVKHPTAVHSAYIRSLVVLAPADHHQGGGTGSDRSPGSRLMDGLVRVRPCILSSYR